MGSSENEAVFFWRTVYVEAGWCRLEPKTFKAQANIQFQTFVIGCLIFEVIFVRTFERTIAGIIVGILIGIFVGNL